MRTLLHKLGEKRQTDAYGAFQHKDMNFSLSVFYQFNGTQILSSLNHFDFYLQQQCHTRMNLVTEYFYRKPNVDVEARQAEILKKEEDNFANQFDKEVEMHKKEVDDKNALSKRIEMIKKEKEDDNEISGGSDLPKKEEDAKTFTKDLEMIKKEKDAEEFVSGREITKKEDDDETKTFAKGLVILKKEEDGQNDFSKSFAKGVEMLKKEENDENTFSEKFAKAVEMHKMEEELLSKEEDEFYKKFVKWMEMFKKEEFARENEKSTEPGDFVSAYVGTSEKTSFCCRQYLTSNGADLSMSSLVEIKGSDVEDVLTTADSLDQVFEEFAKQEHGWVNRTVGCETCQNKLKKIQIMKTHLSEIGLCEYDQNRIKDTKCNQMHNPSSKTIMLLRMLRERGNFVNFDVFAIDNEEIEILYGAMKIKCKNKTEGLSIRARILRHVDFLCMTDHMKRNQLVSIQKFEFQF